MTPITDRTDSIGSPQKSDISGYSFPNPQICHNRLSAITTMSISPDAFCQQKPSQSFPDFNQHDTKRSGKYVFYVSLKE